MLESIVANLLGGLIFLFILWKKLKEDYSSSNVFTLAFYVLLGVLLGFFSARTILPEAWFWFEFLGLSLGFAVGILRFRLRVFETIEAGTVSLLPWLGLVFLKDAIVGASLSSFLAFFVTLCLFTLFFFLDSHYKNFAWYRSGRVGFSGLSTLGTFFLARALFASFFPFVISFIGKYELIFSGIVAFFSYLAVYRLARKS